MKTVINPNYNQLQEFIRNIPDNFDISGVLDYKGRNIIKIMEADELKLNVKSFKQPSFPNNFVYTNFRESKAKRSFEYANLLLKNEIQTPAPVAYIEEKMGIKLKRSFYISIHENTDGMMREFISGKLEGRKKLLSDFARFTANIHEKRILHIDYSPGNILYRKTCDRYEFLLVDLNRMVFGKEVTLEMACFNLRKLFGNEEIISFIASEYAKARNFNPDKCISLLLKEHTGFWAKIIKRHPDYSPYLKE